MQNPLSQFRPNSNLHIVSNHNGASFDSFAYNLSSHDSLYYLFDPTQPIGRRSLASATSGRSAFTVSLFEDGTASIGIALQLENDRIQGMAVAIDPDGSVRAILEGELVWETHLDEDPHLHDLTKRGFINREAALALLNAFCHSDLLHLDFVRASFPSQPAGTDGASYHVTPHLLRENGNLVLEAGSTPRPILPLMVVPVISVGSARS